MRRYIDCFYIGNTNDIEIVCNDFIPYSDFREALADILNAIDSCDTYCISEYFESYGNFDGYIRLMNVNRTVVYRLFGADIEEYMKDGSITLNAHKPTDYDIDSFCEMYS